MKFKRKHIKTGVTSITWYPWLDKTCLSEHIECWLFVKIIFFWVPLKKYNISSNIECREGY